MAPTVRRTSKVKRAPSERRLRKAQALRTRLIDSALVQFDKRGFTRTPIDLITEAADVGKGTFYNYFDSKEALLAAWGRRLLRSAIDLLEESQGGKAPAPARPEPALATIYKFLAALLEPLDKRPRLAAPLVMAFVFASMEDAVPAAPQRVKAAAARKTSGGADEPKSSAEVVAEANESVPRLAQAMEPLAKKAIEQKALRADLGPVKVSRILSGVFYETISQLSTGEVTDIAPRDLLRQNLALALEGIAEVGD